MGSWIALASVVSSAVVGVAALFVPSRAQRVAERRSRARDFRLARRLVVHELKRLRVDLRSMAGAGFVFAPEKANFFLTHAWDTHGAPLAADLSNPVWEAVASVYTGVERLRVGLERNEGKPLKGEPEQWMTQLLKAVELTIGVLEKAEPVGE